jgi:hypothetical protein
MSSSSSSSSSSLSYPFTSINRDFAENEIREADEIIQRIINNDDSVEAFIINDRQVEVVLYRAIELFIINPKPSPINQTLTFENLENVRNKLFEIVTQKWIRLIKFSGDMIYSQFIKYDKSNGDVLKKNPARFRRFCQVIANIDNVSLYDSEQYIFKTIPIVAIIGEKSIYDYDKNIFQFVPFERRFELKLYTALIYLVINNCNRINTDSKLPNMLQVTVFSICQIAIEKLSKTLIFWGKKEERMFNIVRNDLIALQNFFSNETKNFEDIDAVRIEGNNNIYRFPINYRIFETYVKPNEIIEDLKKFNDDVGRELALVQMSEYPDFYTPIDILKESDDYLESLPIYGSRRPLPIPIPRPVDVPVVKVPEARVDVPVVEVPEARVGAVRSRPWAGEEEDEVEREAREERSQRFQRSGKRSGEGSGGSGFEKFFMMYFC